VIGEESFIQAVQKYLDARPVKPFSSVLLPWREEEVDEGGTFPLTSILSHGGERKIKEGVAIGRGTRTTPQTGVFEALAVLPGKVTTRHGSASLRDAPAVNRL